MTPLEQARARMAEPSLIADADARAQVVGARMVAANIQAIADRISEPIPTARKVILLKKAADILVEAAKGISPCAAGCSHCCNMATFITAREADELARASGRTLRTPDVFDAEDATKRFQGIPCPFLRENQCSVYHARPFACRVHISMDRDNLLCKIIPGEEIRTPTINIERFTLLHLMTYRDPLNVKYADIRQFFPPENPC